MQKKNKKGDMQAIKLMRTVKNGKTLITVPKEFGNTVEIIILPVKQVKEKIPAFRKKILDIIGKAKISEGIFMELENGRKEDRF